MTHSSIVAVVLVLGCSSSPSGIGDARQIGSWERTRICDQAGLDESALALATDEWDIEWTCEVPGATVVDREERPCAFWVEESGRFIGCPSEFWGGPYADIALAHEVGHLEGYGHVCSVGGNDSVRLEDPPPPCGEAPLCDIMAPTLGLVDVECVRTQVTGQEEGSE